MDGDMNNYTKLYKSLITSTIWQEDNATRILWITMLALSDADGNVEGSIPGIARMAGITIEECEKALAVLTAPDEYSRSKEHDGRRIEAVDGGWFIINRAKYRDKKSDRTQYMRDYMRERRKEPCKQKVNGSLQNVKSKPNLTQKEKEKEKVNTHTMQQVKNCAVLKGITDEQAEAFFHHYNAQGWKRANGQDITDLDSMLVHWRQNQFKFENKGKREIPTAKERMKSMKAKGLI